MKLERDKWYLNRKGERRRVVCVDFPGGIPVIAHSKGGLIEWYFPDGKIFKEKESSGDLISETKKEPREFWITINLKHNHPCKISYEPVSPEPSEEVIKVREVIGDCE